MTTDNREYLRRIKDSIFDIQCSLDEMEIDGWLSKDKAGDLDEEALVLRNKIEKALFPMGTPSMKQSDYITEHSKK